MEQQHLQTCLTRMKQGDKEAFRQWYNEYGAYIYRTIRLLVNRPEDAADVASEVYMAVFRSLHQYDMNKPFIKWLNGIIVAQSSNWKRRLWRRFRLNQRHQEQHSLVPHQSPSAEDTSEQRERYDELLRLVEQLPFKARSVIILRYYHEYSFQEIADTLGIPLGTAKSRHHHALERLRQQHQQGEQLSFYSEQKGESL
ncbi:sigma-70 family RNA polymerase sigma factor [Paenibacillus kandeliae]|uniref:sigma-70 family RNA polymerase sigma factor n=1 Tax=Paenibacillus kandeliae TaxID=3231269 RepID=UPI0034583379